MGSSSREGGAAKTRKGNGVSVRSPSRSREAADSAPVLTRVTGTAGRDAFAAWGAAPAGWVVYVVIFANLLGFTVASSI